MKFHHTPAPPKSRVELYRHSYGQQRLWHFGLTMIVMGISFFLYYLGLFGRVDGPLNPSQLGEHLAALGVSKAHIMIIVVFLTLLSLTWNWIYNLASFLRGKRLTCSKIDTRGYVCGEPVGRITLTRRKNSKRIRRYLCGEGHKQAEAHFHAVKKGTVGHVVWMISVIFTFIVFYASY